MEDISKDMLRTLTDLIIETTDPKVRISLTNRHTKLARHLHALADAKKLQQLADYRELTSSFEAARDAADEAKKDLSKTAEFIVRFDRLFRLLFKSGILAAA
ncbi:hypothetical protein [Variovorax sp. RCC_210]|uniref:hypothetical protein n=1 Tax=Variovorax sp. RCC_210 TaxID=3239217 RepID=UPI0035237563